MRRGEGFEKSNRIVADTMVLYLYSQVLISSSLPRHCGSFLPAVQPWPRDKKEKSNNCTVQLSSTSLPDLFLLILCPQECRCRAHQLRQYLNGPGGESRPTRKLPLSRKCIKENESCTLNIVAVADDLSLSGNFTFQTLKFVSPIAYVSQLCLCI